MSTLGDFFPSDFKQEFSQVRGISPGDVLRFHCEFTTPPKEKMLVVVCCDPLLVLVINSEINAFILANYNMTECQVDLPVADHDFLDHDSVVNCVRAHSAFSMEYAKEAIAADYGNVMEGRVQDVYMRQIYVAVGKSASMERRHKKKILEAMAQYQ